MTPERQADDPASTADEALARAAHQIDLDIRPPLKAGKALIILVRGKRIRSRVVDAETANALDEALIGEQFSLGQQAAVPSVPREPSNASLSTADNALAEALASGDADAIFNGWCRSVNSSGLDFSDDIAIFAQMVFSLGQQAAVPSVPREPTEGMYRAGERAHDACGENWETQTERGVMRAIHQAMHDAATTPPAPDAGEEGGR